MLTATAWRSSSRRSRKPSFLALFVRSSFSSGGNSGSQASTLVIRAMALGEVRLRDWCGSSGAKSPRVWLLGTVLGTIGFLRITLWHAITGIYGQHYLLVALTVLESDRCRDVRYDGRFAVAVHSAEAGLRPCQRVGTFVATLVDVTGLVIYFTFASLILRGTLL